MARTTLGWWRSGALAGATAVVLGVGTAAAGGAAVAAPAAQPPDATTSVGSPVDLGALFIGAHPDDEAFSLAALGYWKQTYGVRTGVITVTRGEGGGNAVGPEEGPALGLIREREERAAVGMAGVTDVFNLDKVDFYYTVSDPLTQEIWGRDATLEKVVRIIRQTRPEVLLTMNPAPSPGNHGNHQEAARLAIEAFYAAADPNAFRSQITKEGLKPWAAAKVMRGGQTGSGTSGPACGANFTPTDPTANVYGVWQGYTAPDGRSWAAVARAGQRMYASQGWAGFPDVPTDPNALGCNYFTQIGSRVPFPAPGTDAAKDPSAIFQGSLVANSGGLPLGTQLYLDNKAFEVQAGTAFQTKVTVGAPAGTDLVKPKVELTVPSGWKAQPTSRIKGNVKAGTSQSVWFKVTPPASATLGQRSRIAATLSVDGGSGYTDAPVEVTAPVTGMPQLLAQVAEFEQWTDGAARTPELTGTVFPVLTLSSGGSREVRVDVTNQGSGTQSGSVSVTPPAGFSVTPASAAYSGLAPGATKSVTFQVTNTDTSLATSNQGGDYLYTITTTSSGGTDTTSAGLELVPTTSIPESAIAATVDGVESPGEYPGPELNISRLWEGTACSSAADCSATAKVSWHDDTLQVLVKVTDDVMSTKLAAADCKRHWRVDSVELAFDPRGNSENTSSTFKTGIMPFTQEGGPCFERDADNHQGGPETAPGMKVASTVNDPYTGYTIETSIPMADLPAAIDPEHFGMNLFVYDSDTQDLTGQTRIGWSTWGGVQGDPYRWGDATVEGYTPPAGRPTVAPPPIIPLSALSSLDSPQSLAQAVGINVPLAGDPASASGKRGWATAATSVSAGVKVTVQTQAAGTAHLFVLDGDTVLGSTTVSLGKGTKQVTVPVSGAVPAGASVLVGWQDKAGGTVASTAAVG